MSKLGANVYCDLQTGNEFIDTKFFIEVDTQHKPMMEALVANEEALGLLEIILRRFDQISFTGQRIHFYRFIQQDDLASDKVKQAFAWLRRLDQFDGIYIS